MRSLQAWSRLFFVRRSHPLLSTQKDSLVLVKLASFAVRKGVQVLVNLSVFHAFSRMMIGLKAAPVLRFWRSAPPVSV